MDQQRSLERWAATQLEIRGLGITAPASSPNPRPWSTVLRIETSGGVVWAKQGSAGARHEVALLEILAEACPESIVLPIAADSANGRLLLRDGGRILGEELEVGDRFDDVATWERVIHHRADVMIDLATVPVDAMRRYRGREQRASPRRFGLAVLFGVAQGSTLRSRTATRWATLLAECCKHAEAVARIRHTIDAAPSP
jgi:hypothetical protein